jgi:hypothetical protein
MQQSMPPVRLNATSRLLFALAVLAPMTPAPGTAQDKFVQSNPMEVTSDTPEYCLHLLDRVSDLVRSAEKPVPREVTDLTTEGHKMCADGQTRSGIMRLRSALLIMENADKTPYR